jgi:hypothetical protein
MHSALEWESFSLPRLLWRVFFQGVNFLVIDMPEAYREIDRQYFDKEDISYYADEYVDQYGHLPNRKLCDYYPEGCRRCKLASVCDQE